MNFIAKKPPELEQSILQICNVDAGCPLQKKHQPKVRSLSRG
jgi:hypothetical protein